MLERLLITLILAVGFVLICWIIMELWLRSVGRGKEMGLRAKILYTVGRFCQALNHKKDFRHIWMEEEFGDGHLNPLNTDKMDTTTPNRREGREQESRYRDRKYKMKVNM